MLPSLALSLAQDLDLFVNLVHGVTIPGLTTRYNNLNIVVIRQVTSIGACCSNRKGLQLLMLLVIPTEDGLSGDCEPACRA